MKGTRHARPTQPQQSPPRTLDEDEAADLIELFNTRYDSGVKNRAMVRMMLELGLRASELCNLKSGDIDMMSRLVKVRDDTSLKGRNLQMPKSLRDLVGEWLDRRPEADDDWVFPTRNGTKTNPRSVRRTVKNYAEKAGIDWHEEVSPHTLRHTFATDLLRRTGNICAVKRALGHSDLSSTMVYARAVDNGDNGSPLVTDRNPNKTNTSPDKTKGAGYVYVLSNSALDCVKVGYTTRTPERRCEELTGQTGIPEPFEVEGALRCFNPEEVEQEAHKRLDDYRVSESREFFDLRPSNAMACIKEAAVEMNSKVGGVS